MSDTSVYEAEIVGGRYANVHVGKDGLPDDLIDNAGDMDALRARVLRWLSEA